MKKPTQAGLTREINRLEKLNNTYHKDGFTKFIRDEMTRLRGIKIDLQIEKEKEDINCRNRRKTSEPGS